MTVEICELIHTMKIAGADNFDVLMEVHKIHEVKITENTVNGVIKQQTHTEFKIADGLREQAKEKFPTTKGGRKGASQEVKDRIFELYDHGYGISSKAISELEDINMAQVSVANILRDEYGTSKMKDGPRPAEVVQQPQVEVDNSETQSVV